MISDCSNEEYSSLCITLLQNSWPTVSIEVLGLSHRILEAQGELLDFWNGGANVLIGVLSPSHFLVSSFFSELDS